jgi:hypothetical protein
MLRHKDNSIPTCFECVRAQADIVLCDKEYVICFATYNSGCKDADMVQTEDKAATIYHSLALLLLFALLFQSGGNWHNTAPSY